MGRAAAAQDRAVTDAERIAQMRELAEANQAGQPSDAAQVPAAASGQAVEAEQAKGEQEAGQDAGEDEPPAGNEALPLGGQGDSDGLSFFASSPEPGSGGADGGNWVLNTLAALGVVIGLVFGLRWLLRRGGVVSTAAPRGSVVEVLSRTTVAPRSHVVLMRVGQRILIVSDSSAGMRTLGQVEEPEEVAELLGSIDSSSPTSMSASFQGAMKKLSGQWSDAEGAGDADASFDDGVTMDRTRGAVSSLRSRLSMLSKAGGGS